jgi:hypothetical protein
MFIILIASRIINNHRGKTSDHQVKKFGFALLFQLLLLILHYSRIFTTAIMKKILYLLQLFFGILLYIFYLQGVPLEPVAESSDRSQI